MHNLVNINIEAYKELDYTLIRAIEDSELTPESTAEEIENVIVSEIEDVLRSPYCNSERYNKYCGLELTRTRLTEYIVEFPEGEEELATAFYESKLTLEQIQDLLH